MQRPFLLRYEEPVGTADSPEVVAGTMTKTSARESSDQDVSADWMTLGTGTFTENRETVDQDPTRAHMALGTQTHTFSRESAEHDPARVGWAVVPRN